METLVEDVKRLGNREIMSEQLQFERDLYLGFLQQLGRFVKCDIWVKDREGRYLLVNENFCSVMGMDRAELLQKLPSDLFSEERVNRPATGFIGDRRSDSKGCPLRTGWSSQFHDETRFSIRDQKGRFLVWVASLWR